MSDSIKGIVLSTLITIVMTTASAAQECIRTLPAHRDVHWYYYVRKSDGAHCWYPGARSTRVVRDYTDHHDLKPRPQPEPVIKPVPAIEPPALRKATHAEAEALINSTSLQSQPAPPNTPADAIGARWPASNRSFDRSAAGRELPHEHEE